MDKARKSGGFKTLASIVYLIFAISLLFGVCGYCYPQIGEKMKAVVGGAEDSPVREAFGVLAEGFVEYQPAKEVVARSYEVLTGAAP